MISVHYCASVRTLPPAQTLGIQAQRVLVTGHQAALPHLPVIKSSLFKLQCVLLTSASGHVPYCSGSLKTERKVSMHRPFSKTHPLILKSKVFMTADGGFPTRDRNEEGADNTHLGS